MTKEVKESANASLLASVSELSSMKPSPEIILASRQSALDLRQKGLRLAPWAGKTPLVRNWPEVDLTEEEIINWAETDLITEK